VDDLDTPTLVIDLGRVERNIANMAGLAARHGIALRPHVKSHKVVALARMQLEAGATGITCQKLSEAEVMADAGVTDILIAAQIVGPIKVQRLADLAMIVKLTTVVDSVEGAQAIGAALKSRGLELDALVEVDLGFQRCGVAPTDVGEFATRLAAIPGLRFAGVMGYEGQIYSGAHIGDVAAEAERAYERLDIALVSLARVGVVPRCVSVGATAAARLASLHPGITEMRCGSYIFNDLTQVAAGSALLEDCAATVLSTVLSIARRRSAVIDAGAKALSLAQTPGRPGYGLVLGHEASTIKRLSDEHGIIEVHGGPFRMGERVHIVPNSHTTLVNEFSEMVGVRDGRVEEVWPVAARGCIQ
jgi:D-serine deaminase-like pyridoxal phosphate-dependent protein